MGRKRRHAEEDDWSPDEESEGDAEDRKRKREVKKTKKKSKRAKTKPEVKGKVDEDSAALYFHAMDAEKTGVLTLSHIQKMAEALDVDLLEDQMQDMMTYAQEMTQSAPCLDLEAFCTLLV